MRYRVLAPLQLHPGALIGLTEAQLRRRRELVELLPEGSVVVLLGGSAGVPVNMPTHAHGQGYTDLNFLLPELVERIAYRPLRRRNARPLTFLITAIGM